MPNAKPQLLIKRVIINADDFGWSPGVTDGILRAHREGVVTSTTILANFPASASAAERLREAPTLGVGVHLNACQGVPLSQAGAALAGADGRMDFKTPKLILACLRKPSLVDAVEQEFDAQIRWALDRGVRPTHLDTHRHVHAYGPILARVAGLARRYNVRFIRWLGERLSGRGWPGASLSRRMMIRVMCGPMWAGRRAADLRGTLGTWGLRHTGAIDAAWLTLAAQRIPEGATVEIMVHPGMPGNDDPAATRLVASRELELAAVCDAGVRDAFDRAGIERVHYGML